MARLTKDTLFKPTRAESKHATTDSAARTILETEAAARQKKTERLRAMRLEVEAAAEKQQAAFPRAAKAKTARGKKKA